MSHAHSLVGSHVGRLSARILSRRTHSESVWVVLGFLVHMSGRAVSGRPHSTEAAPTVFLAKEHLLEHLLPIDSGGWFHGFRRRLELVDPLVSLLVSIG